MKRLPNLIFILSFLFITANLWSQSALDQKNGFKDFTLGDSFYKWSANLTYFSTLQSGIKVYKYTGACCRTLYGYNIAEIRLGFDKLNELTVIWFTTEKFQKGYNIDKKYTEWNGTKDYEKIRDNIERQFGKASGVDGEESSGKLTLFWIGSKVMLNLEYDYLGIMNGDRCNILVGKFEPSKVNDGF